MEERCIHVRSGVGEMEMGWVTTKKREEMRERGRQKFNIYVYGEEKQEKNERLTEEGGER